MPKVAIIDWETFDTRPTAMVLSLGATCFEPNDLTSWDTLTKQSFYTVFDLDSELDRTISPDTVLWWMRQDKKAITAITNPSESKVSLAQGIISFNTWLRENEVTHLIGNGSNFDNPILENIYQQLNIKAELSYWASLDLRTAKWLATNKNKYLDMPKPAGMIAHNAMHDSIYEAMCFQKYYKELIL